MKRSSLLLYGALAAGLLGSGLSSASAQAPWPFDQPSISSLRQSPKKVFAHYFTVFPTSIDNKSPEHDYYATQWLTPAGEGGKWLAKGGMFRERPLPRTPLGDTNWRDQDLETDVRRAIALGLDGFTVDLLGPPSQKNYNWVRVLALAKAAAKIDPGFKIVPMPDMTAGYAHNPEALTLAITELAAIPSVYKQPDGRIVVSAYCAQTDPPQWWADWQASMQAKGTPVALFPLFQAWRSYVKDYASVSIGASDWGVRSAASNKKNFTDAAQFAHQYVPLWMAPVSFQDYRPKSNIVTEAANSANYRTMWMNAIDGGADWVQLITWNDYSESTEIAPATGTQWSVYDLTAFYTTWFKTGKMPPIKRDVLYYFHRVESSNAPFDAIKHTIQTSIADKSEPFKDDIELLAFLKKPGKLEIEIGGKTQTLDAKAGITSMRVSIAPGTPRFRLTRNGKPEIDFGSAFDIVDKLEFQDLLYRGGSSSRPPVELVQKARTNTLVGSTP